MPSLPASQLADDGEADGTPVPPAYDPSSEEPPVHSGGARKSVGSPTFGLESNAASQQLKGRGCGGRAVTHNGSPPVPLQTSTARPLTGLASRGGQTWRNAVRPQMIRPRTFVRCSSEARA